MKIIYMIRHAKSSWDNISQADFDRPLNDRGKKDAPMMAKRLLAKKVTINRFISSPAKRARKTALSFMEVFDTREKELVLSDDLYEAAPANFYQVIENIDDNIESVAIFSHNPGITEFVNSLTDQKIPNMPTSAIFGVKSDAIKWKEFKTSKKEVLLFDYPKND